MAIFVWLWVRWVAWLPNEMKWILSGIGLFLDVVSLRFLSLGFGAFGCDDECTLNLLHVPHWARGTAPAFPLSLFSPKPMVLRGICTEMHPVWCGPSSLSREGLRHGSPPVALSLDSLQNTFTWDWSFPITWQIIYPTTYFVFFTEIISLFLAVWVISSHVSCQWVLF